MPEVMRCLHHGRGRKVAAMWVLCVSLVSAAAQAPPPVGEAVSPPRTNLQITLWRSGIPGQDDALQELVFSFQRRNPDVIVCIEWKDVALADEWLRRWVGSLRSHAPDLTVAGDLWVWEHRGELLRLPEDLRGELSRTLEESVLERSGGVPRGVPWAVSTPALYYRADLLGEAGREPPTSFEDLVECARALADPPRRYGLGVPGPGSGGEELLHALALAHAPADGSEESEADGIERCLEEALMLLVDMQAEGALQPEVLTWTDVELVEAFAQGRMGMIIGGPWIAHMLQELCTDSTEAGVEWKTAPLPIEEGGVGTVQVDWLIAFNDTDRREHAWRFMRFMAEVETQRILAMLCGVPALKSLADELPPPWAAHVAALHGAEGLPLRGWDRLRVRLGHALFWTLSGRMSPEEALRRSKEEGGEGNQGGGCPRSSRALVPQPQLERETYSGER